jgi:phage repressor protein C with HTH and peptisase S24 domain
MVEAEFNELYRRIERATGIGTQSGLAEAVGVHRSAVSRAKRRGVMPEAWLRILARKYGLDRCWIEKGEDIHEELHRVPKVRARLDAGGGSFEVDSDVEGHYAFRRQWLRSKGQPDQMVLMEVTGDSMEPVLCDGDTVLIDQSQRRVFAGGIYAVGVQDTILVKRVEKHPYRLALISANPGYSPIYLMGDEIDTVRIIGRVVWMCRDMS